LFGVVSGDIADALGLQTGDILQHLNTYDISTPEGALGAFGSLQSATSFTLVVDRRGSSVTLSFEVI
jgi:type II secretory pathway component PulC